MIYQPPALESKPLISNVIKAEDLWKTTEPTNTKPEPKKYKTVANDNLTVIAEAHQTTVERLWRANPQLVDPNTLEINQELIIPLNTDVLAERPFPVTIVNVAPASTRPGEFSNSNPYEWGWCTWYVAQNRPDLHIVDNASGWIRYANSKTPKIGAVAVNTWAARGYGHVAIVVDISATQVRVRHMNYSGFGKESTDWIDLSYFAGYIL